MTDTVQHAINATLGLPDIPAQPSVYEQLEQAVGLLRQAREQRQKDAATIMRLSEAYEGQCRLLSTYVTQLESKQIKVAFLKEESKRLRCVPRWVRWFFGAV